MTLGKTKLNAAQCSIDFPKEYLAGRRRHFCASRMTEADEQSSVQMNRSDVMTAHRPLSSDDAWALRAVG